MINAKVNDLPIPPLLTDRVRIASTGYLAAEEDLRLTRVTTTELQSLAATIQADPAIVLLSAINILLYRYTSQAEIAIAVDTSASAARQQTNNLQPAFILQTHCSANENVVSFINSVNDAANKTDHTPGVELKTLASSLNILVAIEEVPVAGKSVYPPFDLIFRINCEKFASPVITFRYNSYMFCSSRIARMAGHLQQLISHISSSPQTPICNLNMLSEVESNFLLNDRETETLPVFTSIQQWVESTALIYPSHTAVICRNGSLRYDELNEKANQLAAFLQAEATVEPGMLVGIMVKRTEWMIVALLGILKAGAAYLPVDPGYPPDRINYMLADSGVDIIITEKEFAHLAAIKNIKKVYLGEVASVLQKYDRLNPVATTAVSNNAYVIYTSGSTGRPKGVVITHRNVIALLTWAHREYDLAVFKTVFATTSYCFDLSIFEIFFSLSAGKTIRVLGSGLEIPDYSLQDPSILINTVPSVVDTLLKINMDWSNVSVLNMAGEPISLHIKQALDYKRIEVRNLYGPSEDTTYSSCYRFIEEDKVIPIGQPIMNTSFLIFDKHLNMLPVGVPGEIAIAGAGLANGYLNRPELTAVKFVEPSGCIGRRVYLTGDIGVRREDGQFEYVGRSDNQVKIRGFRIELGEVEQAMLQRTGIRHALAMARTLADSEKYLALYYTGTAFKENELHVFMTASLPEYMVPARFVHLDTFPLTVNGKIDRHLLPDPMAAGDRNTSDDYTQDEWQEKLLSIWKLVFQNNYISINDDFFALGGHSLKAVRIIAEIAKQFRVALELQEVLANPKLISLAAHIEQKNGAAYTPVSVVEPRESYPLSYDQMGIWLVDQLHENLSAYNIPYTYRICGQIDHRSLEKALQALVARHEILRTVFVLRQGEGQQKILTVNESLVHITRQDFSLEGDDIALAFLNRQHMAPFDLAKGPLIRAVLVRLADDKHFLGITAHHILFDDWSNDVFKTEFYELYVGATQGKEVQLNALTYQYKDYAAWQGQRLAAGRLKTLEKYWLTIFEKGIVPLALKTDLPRQQTKTFDGDAVSSTFDAAFTRELLDAATAMETTLFTLLMASVKSLLYLHTGQEDITVATPVAQRLQPEWHDQLGIYSNIILLRTTLCGQLGFDLLVNEVKKGVMEAHLYHDYPFFQFANALQSNFDNPGLIFNVMMTMQQEEIGEIDKVWSVMPVPCTGVKTDLEFNFNLKADQTLYFSLAYSTQLFKKETASMLIQQMRMLLTEILAAPQKQLDELALPTLGQPVSFDKAKPAPRAVIEKKKIQEVMRALPANNIESQLLKIWTEIFQRKGINTTDNFILLGGHSIKAMQIKIKIVQSIGVEIKIADVFKYHSIKILAEYIRTKHSGPFKMPRQTKYDTIKPTEKKQYYPLPSIQRPLYMVQQIYPDSIAYNIVDTIPIKGEIDPYFVESIIRKMVERHEIFRTSFRKVDGTPTQVIQDTVEFNIQFCKSTENSMAELIRNLVKPFDLACAPLLRLFYVTGKLGPLFLIDIHHIISDALSIRRFYEEVELLARGQLPAQVIQYKDFSAWLERNKKKTWMQEQANFWKSQFDDQIPVLNLPTDFPRPKIKTYNGRVHQFALSKKSIEPVQVFCRLHNTSLFTALLSVYYLLLAKLSGQKDIVVGIPATFRNNPGLKWMQGMFVNTLPVRLRIDSEQSFTDVLLNVRSIFLKALDQQDYQPDDLISSLRMSRDSSRSPLYDVMFNMLNHIEISMNIEDAVEGKVNHYDGVISSQFDLILQAIEHNSDVVFALSYNTDLFKAQTIHRFSEYFKNILAFVIIHPRHPISKLDYLPAAEKGNLLKAYYKPADYMVEKSIIGMFKDAVAAHPGRTAVVSGNTRLSFAELYKKSGDLAAVIREKNVDGGRFIPILLKRDVYMPVVIWGVLRAELAFVPISPDWPLQRTQVILKDIGSTLLITNIEKVEQLQEWKELTIIVAGEGMKEAQYQTMDTVTLDDAIYTVFTSGTTGKPKGAINLHRGFTNRLQYLNNRYTPGSNDVMLLTNNYIFDSAIYQILWPIATGFQLVIPEAGAHFDLDQMVSLMQKHQVTIVDFVPSVLAVLRDMMDKPGVQASMQSLRHLIVGGEAMNAQVVYRIKAFLPRLTVTNDYGPTETAVSTVFYQLPDAPVNPVPIGKPMDNVRILILDEDEAMVPAGVAGELYLGGDCVGAGYLNRPELTRRSFKYIQVAGWGQQLFYKTGDHVKLLPDDNMQFIGRADDQVKIRGFRIEPEEIKVVLLEHHQVKQAVVTVHSQGDEKSLAAYYTGETGIEHDIKEHLSAKLPQYMVPASIMHLDEFPVASMGKLDMTRLPKPINMGGTSALAFLPPRNETEKRMLAIWQDLLEDKNIGVMDDFFLIGGHSLKAIQLNHRIQREFDIELPLNHIFSSPTIAAMAEALQHQVLKQSKRILPVEKKMYYPASNGQKRIWFIEQFDESAGVYNIPGQFSMNGPCHVEALRYSLQAVLARHESLRTSFFEKDGFPMQRIHAIGSYELPFEELDLSGKKEQSFLNYARLEASRPFDLTQAPLLRMKLLHRSAGRHTILFTVHHIISDGWSAGVLMKEIFHYYNTFEGDNKAALPALAIQYKDFTNWQNDHRREEALNTHRQYWLSQFNDKVPVLDLPADFERPAMQAFVGGEMMFFLDTAISDQIKRLSKEAGTTVFMTLVAILKALIFQYSGKEDIVLGLPVAGREHADLESQIGFYANTVAIRTRFVGSNAFTELLANVKQVMVDAYDHQAYPFDRLVEDIQYPRDISRNPLFDIMITGAVEKSDAPADAITMYSAAPVYISECTCKFDLSFEFTEYRNAIRLQVAFNSALFRQERIAAMILHYQQVAQYFSDHARAVNSLQLTKDLPAADKNRLIKKPVRINYADDDMPADSATTLVLKEIWEEVLQVKHIKPTDNFFTLGGNSLKTLQVQARVYQKLGIRIKVKELFIHATIQQLAISIQQQCMPLSSVDDEIEIVINDFE